MSSSKITIFIAPAAVTKVTGRYICLLRAPDEEGGRFFADDSLVELSNVLTSHNLDWSYIEADLIEKGVYSS